MKIAVFIKSTTFHRGYGGLETQNKALCEGLVARGHEITVFSPKREYGAFEAQENGVNYIFVPSVYKMLFASVNPNNWYNKSYKAFQEIHIKNHFDLVVSQSSAGLGIIKNKNRINIKVVAITHGSILGELSTRYKNLTSIFSLIRFAPDVVYSVYNFFNRQRQFLHGADKIVSVSNFVKDSLVEEAFVSEDKFVVINNGINASKFVDIIVNSDAPKFLYTSQVIKEKGVDYLLDIFKDPAFAAYTVDVIGGGRYLEQFKKEVKKLNLENKINVIGKLSYDDLIKKYTSGQYCIYLFPTKRLEGFPMVLAESMYCGIPVVAFDLGGVSDAVRNNETGFLIKSGDIATFKQKLLVLAESSELKQKFSSNGRILAQTEFTVDAMLNKYENVFQEIGKKINENS